jgi:alpha-mannosidase
LPLEIHLVTHTHWDREWYHTAEVFRQRLVALIDELIDDPPRRGEPFLLDGQAIVIEDYLAVRPERRVQLEQLLRDQRVEAGPWYVLADELIPSGEALVRNLLVGRSVLKELGATSPPVLYSPDSFGHPGTLPEIAAGFGLPLVVLWRGYGGKRHPRGDVASWRAPSASQVLLFQLPPDGYEFGSSLPADESSARKRWGAIRSTLAPRSTLGVTLLMNGADHHARQRDRDVAVQRLQLLAEQGKDRVVVSSLRRFAESLVEKASAQRVPSISGELRDSYGYTWTLQGTFGTRAAQKRLNAIAERALIRQAEPWSAVAWFLGGESRNHLTRAAWKTLLTAHPHDTLCGTSIDDVADAMDVRVRAASAQAASITTSAIDHLLGRHASAERERASEWKSFVVIQNDSVHARSGVALIELVEKIADERVGPGSAGGPNIDDLRRDTAKPLVPKGMQLIESRVVRDRIESPRHYPDNDIVRITTVAGSLPDMRALSLTPSEWPGPELTTHSGRVRTTADELSNAIVSCRVDAKGFVTVESQRVIERTVRFEDREDRGDLYTPSIRDECAHAEFAKRKVTHRGPVVAEMELRWKLVGDSDKRGASRGDIAVAARVVAGSPLVELTVDGNNASTNHRLRIGIATGVPDAKVVADAAFGPIERAAIAVSDADAAMERPTATAPLHRYVSLFSAKAGATIFSDGLAEYEADDEGVVWITLVRAVGELSRNDVPERPGHAGWPVDTPRAQSIGSFKARLALLLHGARTPTVVDEIEREADRFLLPLRGFTVRSAVTPVNAVSGPELSGSGLTLSAVKQSEDERWLVLRCVNLGTREQAGRWILPRAITEAKLARLDETPISDIAIASDARLVEFVAGPRAVVTLLVR